MLTISRRGLLALGGAGAAGAALTACGAEDDPRAEGRDPELLGAMLEAELGVEASAKATSGQPQEAQAVAELVEAVAEASGARVQELRGLASDAGAPEPSAPQAERSLPALAAAIQPALAAYHEGSGLLSSTELRSTATSFLAQCAAAAAAIADQIGEDPVPQPFVTGGGEAPLAAAPPTTTTSTASTTPTTTATGSEDGG
ncbi:MAG: hypothetical protein GEU88_16175 [Solirubrobacterales bacterium]|nr:hypothetical protein [Solirubrobacterales bacterium]